MHLFLHILKFVFEGVTLIAVAASIVVLLGALIPDNKAMDMKAFADLATIAIFLVIAALALLAWLALVYFAHLPWWL